MQKVFQLCNVFSLSPFFPREEYVKSSLLFLSSLLLSFKRVKESWWLNIFWWFGWVLKKNPQSLLEKSCWWNTCVDPNIAWISKKCMEKSNPDKHYISTVLVWLLLQAEASYLSLHTLKTPAPGLWAGCNLHSCSVLCGHVKSRRRVVESVEPPVSFCPWGNFSVWLLSWSESACSCACGWFWSVPRSRPPLAEPVSHQGISADNDAHYWAAV